MTAKKRRALIRYGRLSWMVYQRRLDAENDPTQWAPIARDAFPELASLDDAHLAAVRCLTPLRSDGYPDQWADLITFVDEADEAVIDASVSLLEARCLDLATQLADLGVDTSRLFTWLAAYSDGAMSDSELDEHLDDISDKYLH
jgi:hypothetical protein